MCVTYQDWGKCDYVSFGTRTGYTSASRKRRTHSDFFVKIELSDWEWSDLFPFLVQIYWLPNKTSTGNLVSYATRPHRVISAEKVGSVDNNSDLYSGGIRFDSRHGYRQSWLRFFFAILGQMLGYFLTLGHARFLPHSFTFIILSHSLFQCHIFRVSGYK
jgi:hypothetical protein